MAEDANLIEFKRWYSQAQHDLDAARSSSSSGHFEWACFQAQQAAEKVLKAFLYLNGKRAIISHSVMKLLQECEQIDPAFSSVSAARELDQYYIPTRYPNGLPEQIPHDYFNAEDARKCIAHATTVLEFVSERAKPSTA
ncbi:MAG: HEPN domain-containing protein [Chloroflexi bacterium]|nr:HEPN domain-containing protein [Chloroflexota bacterium]